MGLFDKIKEGFKSAVAYAKMDDFLIEHIDGILCERWQKVTGKKPANVAGISLEEEAEYNFTYQYESRTIRVEMEHEFPNLEIEMENGRNKYETTIQVSDFVDKDGTEFSIKNKSRLRAMVNEMAGLVE